VSQRTTETIEIAASPDAVFAIAADFASYPKWIADLKSITVLASDAEGRATEVEFRAAAFGRSSVYALRYDYADAPQSLRWQQLRGDLTTKLDGAYRFAPSSVGTRVTYELEVELLVPLPSFVKARAASRIVSQALRELKARAEHGA
jgi:ribosome-associated toxin RatA of RatAB toxin-antitoxin module